MAKNKQRRSAGRETANTVASERPSSAELQVSTTRLTPHPPAKNPTLLVASAVLFALWFIFLLSAAWQASKN